MTLRLICPNGHALIVEDAFIGHKVRCPACKLVMLVPGPSPAAAVAPPRPTPPPLIPPDAVQRQPPPPLPVELPLEELEELFEEPAYADERPRKQGMKTRQRMRLANIGLGFHYAKVLCMLVALIFALSAFTVAPLLQSGGFFTAASCLAVILTLVTPVLGGTGSLLCFWLPAKSNARVLVIVSFGLEVGGTVLMLVVPFLMLGGSAAAAGDPLGAGQTYFAVAGAGSILTLLASLVIYAGFILFLIVLRALATYLRDHSTADEATRQLIMYLIVTLGGGMVWVVLLFVLPSLGRVGGYLLFAVMVGWIVGIAIVLFAILTVISTVRAQINRRYG